MERQLSKFRAQLMGLMILWVMFFHVKIGTPPFPLNYVRMFGYAGVDGFLFLSGMGLYCSYYKNRNLAGFYMKRFKRLLPAYYPVLLLWGIVTLTTQHPENPVGVLVGNMTGQAFWNNYPLRFNWYIEAVWLFYALAPFFIWLLEQPKKKYLWITVTVLLLMNTVFFDNFTLIAISRFPIFMIGLYFGKRLCEKKVLSRKGEALLYILSIVGFAAALIAVKRFNYTLWKYGMWWHPFILITPGLLCFLCRVLNVIRRVRPLKWINTVLSGFGGASFELYLVHVFIFETLLRNNWKMLLLSIVIAFPYHYFIEFVSRRCRILKG